MRPQNSHTFQERFGRERNPHVSTLSHAGIHLQKARRHSKAKSIGAIRNDRFGNAELAGTKTGLQAIIAKRCRPNGPAEHTGGALRRNRTRCTTGTYRPMPGKHPFRDPKRTIARKHAPELGQRAKNIPSQIDSGIDIDKIERPIKKRRTAQTFREGSQNSQRSTLTGIVRIPFRLQDKPLVRIDANDLTGWTHGFRQLARSFPATAKHIQDTHAGNIEGRKLHRTLPHHAPLGGHGFVIR